MPETFIIPQGNPKAVNKIADNSISNPATSEMQENIENTLNDIRVFLAALAHVKGPLANLRVTITDGTVTTVAAVTNQTQVGGYIATPQIPSLTNIAAVQSNINNLVIS